MRRWSLFAALAFVGCLLALAACGSSTSTSGAAQVASVARSLPLGDGKLSSSARRGYVYSCSSGSEGGGGAGGGGASSEEPWIHGSTWDPAQKISVKGRVHWSQARLSIKRKGARRVISTNDLPMGATTGRFPISSSERAYTYDHNPNRIEAQRVKLSLPREPKSAKQPSCLGFGDIGVLKDGGLLTNGQLDACHGRVSKVSWNGRKVRIYHYVATAEYPYTLGCYHGTPIRSSVGEGGGRHGPPGQGGPPPRP